MTPRNLHRFDFGTLRDFRGPIQIAPETIAVMEEEAPPPPPPPPTFSEDELQRAKMDARKQGYAEGFIAGQTQTAGEQDAHREAAETAVIALSEQIGKVLETYHTVLREQSLQLSELSLLVAKKVAGDALNKNSIDAIAALIVRTLPMVLTRPRLNIELHPDTQAAAEMMIMGMMVKQGYEGALHFRSNPELALSDARLDWGTGQVERSTDSLWQDVEHLLARVPLEIEIPTLGDTNG